MAVSFLGGGNRSTLNLSPNSCTGKSWTNIIVHVEWKTTRSSLWCITWSIRFRHLF